MSVRYAAEIKIGLKADQVTVAAEDALIAAVKVTGVRPEAAVTYVRKHNARGDRRHPHPGPINEKRSEPVAGPRAPATPTAQGAG